MSSSQALNFLYIDVQMSSIQTEHEKGENIFLGYFVMVVIESFPNFHMQVAHDISFGLLRLD